jgi:hypothetical protein
MKKIPATILSISLLIPGFVAATQDPFDAYVDKMIKEAEENGTAIHVESHSSVTTGGQVAGQTVTDGDVSASSHIETRINAGEDGGTVYVKTETSQNGETETEEYTKEVEPGEPIEVKASAKVTPEEAEIETEIQGETMEASSTIGADAVETEDVSITGRIESALESVPGFFRKVIEFVKFW